MIAEIDRCLVEPFLRFRVFRRSVIFLLPPAGRLQFFLPLEHLLSPNVPNVFSLFPAFNVLRVWHTESCPLPIYSDNKRI